MIRRDSDYVPVVVIPDHNKKQEAQRTDPQSAPGERSGGIQKFPISPHPSILQESDVSPSKSYVDSETILLSLAPESHIEELPSALQVDLSGEISSSPKRPRHQVTRKGAFSQKVTYFVPHEEGAVARPGEFFSSIPFPEYMHLDCLLLDLPISLENDNEAGVSRVAHVKALAEPLLSFRKDRSSDAPRHGDSISGLWLRDSHAKVKFRRSYIDDDNGNESDDSLKGTREKTVSKKKEPSAPTSKLQKTEKNAFSEKNSSPNVLPDSRKIPPSTKKLSLAQSDLPPTHAENNGFLTMKDALVEALEQLSHKKENVISLSLMLKLVLKRVWEYDQMMTKYKNEDTRKEAEMWLASSRQTLKVMLQEKGYTFDSHGNIHLHG